jgi:arylsulfatase A-like enzyme
VHVIDVVPTALELAGVEPPREHAGRPVPALHGRSFATALKDPAAPPAHDTLWWCHEGHRAVRTGDWKLVAAKGTPWELYDLAADRCETNNLAAGEPARVAALEAAWTRIAEECRTLAAADAPAELVRPAAAVKGKRPNIIYVMTDDQGYGDIAAHGNAVIRTPNLDRLHKESVRLTEFHASPTCSPTRAALMTGRHEFRSGVTHTINERERLALSATTLPQLLKTAGYTNGIFGKWHLGDEDAYQPGKRGFDRVFIHGGGGIGQNFPGSCGDAPGNSYFNPAIRSDGTFVKTKGYCTDVFFDAALDWIDRCRKEGKPFFCYVTPNAPHGPLDCPRGSDTPYLARLEAAGVKDPRQRAEIAKFYGMIENIDANVGRLLAGIDRLGVPRRGAFPQRAEIGAGAESDRLPHRFRRDAGQADGEIELHAPAGVQRLDQAAREDGDAGPFAVQHRRDVEGEAGCGHGPSHRVGRGAASSAAISANAPPSQVLIRVRNGAPASPPATSIRRAAG